MFVKRKRILRTQQYLYEFAPDEPFYITVPLHSDDKKVLSAYGLDTAEMKQNVPIPWGGATTENVDGRWIIHRNQPKKPRTFEREYHIVDWHGGDHYGTCYQTRMCYPRTKHPPMDIALCLENNIVFSPLFHNRQEDMRKIKLTFNMMLEMFGRCETWTKDKAPAAPPIEQKKVPWEILRAGTKNQDIWAEYVANTVQAIPSPHRAIIKRRHEHLWKQNPDFCVLGSQNFWGYVVYGFKNENLFIFECNRLDNATYIFKGDWEQASRLSKTEILSGNIQEARLFHTSNWKTSLNKLIVSHKKGVA
jgi:hypothetical protein